MNRVVEIMTVMENTFSDSYMASFQRHVVLMLCDFSLCSDEYDIIKTCAILVWLKMVFL